MKKTIFRTMLLAFGAIAAASLVACSKNNAQSSKKEGDKTILVFGASRGEEAACLEEIIKVFNEKTGYNVVMEDFFTVLQEKKICLILTKWN